MKTTPMQLAEKAVAHALAKGAREAAAQGRRARSISVHHRNGQVEQVRESNASSLQLDLYVDGRFSSHSTSDLRWDAVATFIEQAIVMTRLLGEDPHRSLADPKLYLGRSDADLGIVDRAYGEIDTPRRLDQAARIEAAARAVEGPIISATSWYSDGWGESAQVHSNGFSGTHESTSYWIGAEVSVEGEGGRRPEAGYHAGARLASELADPAEVGRRAAEKALSRIGQKTLASGERTLVFENRTATSLLRHLVAALSGAALHQKRSFLLDKKGQRIGSPLLTLVDDPLLKGGFGSRHYDSDGLAAGRRVLVQGGVLQDYLVSVYYGRKLGWTPTGGSTSNLVLTPGERSPEAIIADVKDGIFVTGLLGGNSDPTAGSFSHGLVGFEIQGGRLGAPVGEMNVTGSHTDLWERLVAVGNDPYPYSNSRIPTLVFDGVAVSGR